MSSYTFNPLQMAIKPLYERAIASDPLFAQEVKEKEGRAEKPKSLAECAEYIMGEAYEYASKHRDGDFGMAGLPEDDMVSLIKHYYDEDDIEIKKVGKSAKASVTTTGSKPAKASSNPASKGKGAGATATPAKATKPADSPKSPKDAKRESKEQAESVQQLSLF